MGGKGMEAGRRARAAHTVEIGARGLTRRPALSRFAVDVAMLVTAAAAAWAMPLGDGGISSIWWAGAYCVAVTATLAIRGSYSSAVRPRLAAQLRTVAGSVLLVTMAVISIRVLASGDGALARETAGVGLYALAFLTLGRLHLSSSGSAARSAAAPRRTLILGAGKVGNMTAARLRDNPQLGLEPIAFLDDDPVQLPGEGPVLPILGGSPDLDRIVEEHQIQHLIIGFSQASDHLMLALVRRSWELGLSVSLVPRLFEVEGSRATIERLGGLPLVALAPAPSRGVALTAKYAIDRAVAASGLILTAPLLAVIAVALRITIGDPVLYGQHRVGRDGRRFVMWKFRTMTGSPEEHGEADAGWAAGELGLEAAAGGAAPAPDRSTRLGGILRRLSLDELPQLWNVVRGEMSLIGPRPERVHYVERFEEAIYRYGDRHRVKSGITGWAQVNGLRGETSLAERVEWDNYYIDNWSPGLDLAIAFKTIGCLLRPARRAERAAAAAPPSEAETAASHSEPSLTGTAT